MQNLTVGGDERGVEGGRGAMMVLGCGVAISDGRIGMRVRECFERELVL